MSRKKQNNKEILYNKISEIFRNNPTKSFNYKQIKQSIGFKKK